MLERLVQLLEDGVTTVASLAGELDVSHAMVETMLEDLARRGLVRAVESCSGACHGCGVSGCLSSWRGRAWTVVAPGRPEDRKQS